MKYVAFLAMALNTIILASSLTTVFLSGTIYLDAHPRMPLEHGFLVAMLAFIVLNIATAFHALRPEQ